MQSIWGLISTCASASSSAQCQIQTSRFGSRSPPCAPAENEEGSSVGTGGSFKFLGAVVGEIRFCTSIAFTKVAKANALLDNRAAGGSSGGFQISKTLCVSQQSRGFDEVNTPRSNLGLLGRFRPEAQGHGQPYIRIGSVRHTVGAGLPQLGLCWTWFPESSGTFGSSLPGLSHSLSPSVQRVRPRVCLDPTLQNSGGEGGLRAVFIRGPW